MVVLGRTATATATANAATTATATATAAGAIIRGIGQSTISFTKQNPWKKQFARISSFHCSSTSTISSSSSSSLITKTETTTAGTTAGTTAETHEYNEENDKHENKSNVCIHNFISSQKQQKQKQQYYLPYVKGWAWQTVLLQKRLQHRRELLQQSKQKKQIPIDSDILLFLEHDHVYTLGRGANEQNLMFLKETNSNNDDDNIMMIEKLKRNARGSQSARLCMDIAWKEYRNQKKEKEKKEQWNIMDQVNELADASSPVLAPNGTPIYRIDRGGDVTYHGPGQLIGYPLIDLQRKPFLPDLHWYLRSIEEIIIQVLKVYDINGIRDNINTGVWVNQEKIAAVGVSSSRWITTHGFALNVCPDLSFFDTSIIIPCGIYGRNVTSIEQIAKQRGWKECDIPSVQDVMMETKKCFERVFGVTTTTTTTFKE